MKKKKITTVVIIILAFMAGFGTRYFLTRKEHPCVVVEIKQLKQHKGYFVLADENKILKHMTIIKKCADCKPIKLVKAYGNYDCAEERVYSIRESEGFCKYKITEITSEFLKQNLTVTN